MTDLCIEFCLDNVDERTRVWLRRAGERWHIEVIEDVCLGRCGECDKAAFLLVDGQMVQGKSHRDILKTALQHMSERP